VTTTWDICGDQWDVAQTSFLEGGTSNIFVNFTSMLDGATVALTPTCQANVNEAAMARGYSASGGHLTFITSYANYVVVGSYEKR
jgi:hypothetical protein